MLLVQKICSHELVVCLFVCLFRVSDPEHVKHNSMPPSNLGTVFGPNRRD